MLIAAAYAKLNLNLEILGKRADGFHNIASILQKITLSDNLGFKESKNLILECDIAELNNENNLVYRAAKLLQLRTAHNMGARIILHKHIPTSAGLGGGSSDAATTLVTLNEMWNTALSPTELENIGAELGSDIPFFIQNTTALVEGRGEKITTLNAPRVSWVVLLIPPLQIQHKTQRVFDAIKEQDYTDGETIVKIARQMENSQIHIEAALAKNHLENGVLKTFQGIESYRETFSHMSHSPPQFTGAGPTYFSIFPNEDQAQIAAKSLENLMRAEIMVASTIE
jgi:4-diphosphocytidyl-2-C-methyl-D-erythritol kinase